MLLLNNGESLVKTDQLPLTKRLYRILIAQGAKYLRLLRVKDLDSSAEISTNLQYGWNGLTDEKGFTVVSPNHKP